MPKPGISELASKRIIGFLNWQRARKGAHSANTLKSLIADLQNKKPDHLVITGDLVNIALDGEFKNTAHFLQSLGNPDGISVVCGNHDAYVPGAMASAIEHWQPWMAGDDRPLTSTEDYPVMRKFGDVALISCNSAEATLPFMATGYFRQNQANRLSELLDKAGRQNLCRVVVIHHPPVKGATLRHKRLIGTELFQQTIRGKGAELILHGHTHLATRHQIAGPKGPVPVISVPAASNEYGGNKPAARYNIFEISKKADVWSINMEEHGISDATGTITRIAKHTLS